MLSLCNRHRQGAGFFCGSAAGSRTLTDAAPIAVRPVPAIPVRTALENFGEGRDKVRQASCNEDRYGLRQPICVSRAIGSMYYTFLRDY